MGQYMPAVMQKQMATPDTLHQSTARLLAARFKLGLFEPDNAAVPKFSLDHVDSDAHRALALKQARQAIVLLQNLPRKGIGANGEMNGTEAPLLPLKKGAKVAMIGPNANASLNLLSGYVGSLA